MSFNISVTGKMEDGSLLRAAGSWSTTDGKQSGRFELRFSPPPAGSPSLPNVPMPGRFQFLFFNEEEDRVFPELRHGEACFEKIIGRGTDAQSNVRGFFCNSAPDSSAEDSAATAAAAAESIDKTIKLVGTFFPTTEDGALVQLTVLRNVPEEDLDQWVAQYRGIEQRLHMRAALAAQLKAERDAAALKEKLAAERRRRRKPTVSATVGYGSVSAAPAAASSSAAASSVQTALGSVNSRKGGAAVSSATNSASGTSSAEPSKSRKAKAPRDASTEAAPSAKDALASTLATEVSAARPPVKRARKIRRSANSGLSRMLKPKFVGIQTSHPVVLLLGPPGVGKGTQGMLLQQYLGFKHISCGEMYRRLRAEDTRLDSRLGNDIQAKLDAMGEKKQEYRVRSEAIDECLFAALKHGVEEDRSCFGFVIDGCRSREQAERIRGVLDRVKLKLTLVVPLGVSEVAARRRLASRLVHAATGRVYSADTVAGASGGIPHSSSNGDAEHSGTALVDAATGDKLERRKDDQDEEVIATRFKAYEERKGDLLTYLRSLRNIVTAQELVTTGLSVNEVYTRLAGLVLRETRPRCPRTNLNFVRPAMPHDVLASAPDGVRGAAVVLLGPSATLARMASQHFLPNDEVSGLIPWSLSQAPAELLESVRTDSRWNDIGGIENLGLEGLLREAIGCPAYAGSVAQLHRSAGGFGGGSVSFDTKVATPPDGIVGATVKFAAEEMAPEQLALLHEGCAVTFNVLRHRKRVIGSAGGQHQFESRAVNIVVHESPQTARQAVEEPPAAKPEFKKSDAEKSTTDISTLVCLEGLSEKAQSKGYTAADLTVPGGGLDKSVDARCSLRCGLRELVEETGITLDAGIISAATQAAYRAEAGLTNLPMFRDTVSNPPMRVYFIMLPPNEEHVLLCPALFASNERTFQHEHRSRLPRDDRACSLLRIHDLRRPQLQPEPDVTQTNWTAAYGPKFKCVVYTHGLTGEQVPAALQKALVEAGWCLEMTTDGRRLYWLNIQTGEEQPREGKFLEAPPGFVVDTD